MSIPDYQSLMLPLLRVAAEKETRAPEAAEQIAAELGLGQADRDERLPSGRQRVLHNRVHWAKFYLSKAGLLESPGRGRFKASPAGKELLSRNPTGISVALLKEYPQFLSFYNANAGAVGITDAPVERAESELIKTPEEQIEAANAVLLAALKADLLQRVYTQSPGFFERLIVDLLLSMGYGGSHEAAAAQLGKSGDGGIDGVINEDRLGLDRIYVQAKRYASHVGVGRPEVQGFVGSLVGLGAAKGVFVTTSSFSGHAVDYVKRLPQRVILIDGERLADLMVEHGVGVRVSRTVLVKRLDEDFFTEE